MRIYRTKKTSEKLRKGGGKRHALLDRRQNNGSVFK